MHCDKETTPRQPLLQACNVQWIAQKRFFLILNTCIDYCLRLKDGVYYEARRVYLAWVGSSPRFEPQLSSDNRRNRVGRTNPDI